MRAGVFRAVVMLLFVVFGIGCDNSGDSLVGKDWLDVRPAHCPGETLFIRVKAAAIGGDSP